MKHDIPFESPYEYVELTQETEDGRRLYIYGEEKLPSVTTILSGTKKGDSLKKWVEKVGEEEAERIRSEAAARGSEMHAILEKQLKEGSIWNYYPDTHEKKRAYKMACTIMDQGFPSIDQVYGCEVPLYYPGKYAGTAYATAHNALHGTDIRKGVIMMCSVDGFYQEFVLENREFDRAVEAWNDRVERFSLL